MQRILTEQKRYYASNYGIENYIDIVNGKTDKIVKGTITMIDIP